MISPERIVVAGDWHGAQSWATGVIDLLPRLLPDESPRLLLHLGDFGVWPGESGARYLIAVRRALAAVGGELWFVDGNHECFPMLHAAARDAAGRGLIQEQIRWLPRGHRWSWHGRRWLALGGATSVDRPIRTAGRDWWPEEAITYRQGVKAMEDGQADVMVTHDCPSGVPLNLPTPPAWWEMEPAENHRDVLAEIVAEVKPKWLMHGHYHLAHDTTVQMPHGTVRVTGLDCENTLTGNYRVLDVRSMAWETP